MELISTKGYLSKTLNIFSKTITFITKKRIFHQLPRCHNLFLNFRYDFNKLSFEKEKLMGKFFPQNNLLSIKKPEKAI